MSAAADNVAAVNPAAAAAPAAADNVAAVNPAANRLEANIQKGTMRIQNIGAAWEVQGEIQAFMKTKMAGLAVRLAGASIEDGPEAYEAIDATVDAINRMHKMIKDAAQLRAQMLEFNKKQY
jgi:ribosome-associated translation inhibitor RaiA